jgi:hypothetical protein
MSRQPFLTIVRLLKHALAATPRPFLSVLAILVLVPAVAVAGDPWDKQMNAKGRFEVLPAFDNAAVLDKETQLVWEQSPGDTNGDGVVNFADLREWGVARSHCINKDVGGRKGWRLPSVPELASLVDPSVAAPGPTLPAGHPFSNVQSSNYWSATTFADNPLFAWSVGFDNGLVGAFFKINTFFVWCARGPMNADQY